MTTGWSDLNNTATLNTTTRRTLENDITIYVRKGGSESNKGDSPSQAFPQRSAHWML